MQTDRQSSDNHLADKLFEQPTLTRNFWLEIISDPLSGTIRHLVKRLITAGTDWIDNEKFKDLDQTNKIVFQVAKYFRRN